MKRSLDECGRQLPVRELPALQLRGRTSPVEIFSIGTELLIGRIQDTNSFWLAQQASEFVR